MSLPKAQPSTSVKPTTNFLNHASLVIAMCYYEPMKAKSVIGILFGHS